MSKIVFTDRANWQRIVEVPMTLEQEALLRQFADRREQQNDWATINEMLDSGEIVCSVAD